MAVRDSVTVSMAAETMGMFSRIFCVSQVAVSTSRGRTLEAAGTSSRSSNVRDSFTTSSNMVSSVVMG
ncbi:MAG: hypothetical protein BWX45_00985 [Deltaproteobacteria bacterium ADurb.Bin002]|nr:MAG: hypothetical protein BWX45_00985 [Deltaproteobacteria bacterium ADurb.Bin002]